MKLTQIKKIGGGCLGLLCVMIAISAEAASTESNRPEWVISTMEGKVQGISTDNNQVVSFRGIPYAADPFTPDRRFKAPQPMKPWQGVLNTTQFMPPVIQPSRGKTVSVVGAAGNLTLNIWAPQSTLKSRHKVPVMVWIPGGAFIRSDASESVYNGKHFAEQGLVVVTINYRVGVDGFMHIPGMPDNRGILDQIAALKWVQQNIARFGGNPGKVTVFGQSSGAESVAILLGTPSARGLFQKAIMQSPPMQSVTPSQSLKIAQAFAKKVHVKLNAKSISQVPYLELVKTVLSMGNAIQNRSQWGQLSWGGTAFLPITGTHLIPKTPLQNLKKYADSHIPVIVGCTDNESRLYIVALGLIDTVKESTLKQLIADMHLPKGALDVYEDQPNYSVGDAYADAMSDYTFRMPAQHIADALVKNGNPVWDYQFGWRSPMDNGRLWAAHFVDVPYTFEILNTPQAISFVGENPDKALSELIHNNWSHFAKTGYPNWTRYDLQDRPTMKFNSISKELNDPLRSRRELWEHYRF